MKLSTHLIELIETTKRTLISWDLNAEYGSEISGEEAKALYADMRAVSAVADLVCNLLTDPMTAGE